MKKYTLLLAAFAAACHSQSAPGKSWPKIDSANPGPYADVNWVITYDGHDPSWSVTDINFANNILSMAAKLPITTDDAFIKIPDSPDQGLFYIKFRVRQIGIPDQVDVYTNRVKIVSHGEATYYRDDSQAIKKMLIDEAHRRGFHGPEDPVALAADAPKDYISVTFKCSSLLKSNEKVEWRIVEPQRISELRRNLRQATSAPIQVPVSQRGKPCSMIIYSDYGAAEGNSIWYVFNGGHIENHWATPVLFYDDSTTIKKQLWDEAVQSGRMPRSWIYK